MTNPIDQALLFLAKNFMKDVNLDSICKEVGLSKFHFHRLFKQATNETFLSYLHRLRMEHATHLLAIYPTIQLIEVAFESGYATPAEFSRVFKKKQGVSASEYRKKRLVPSTINPSIRKTNIPISYQKRVTILVHSSNLIKENLTNLFEKLLTKNTSVNSCFGIFIDAPIHHHLEKCRYYAGWEIQSEPTKKSLTYEIEDGYYTYLDIQGDFSNVTNQIIQFKEQEIDASDYEIASFVAFEKFDLPNQSSPFDYFSTKRRLFIRMKRR